MKYLLQGMTLGVALLYGSSACTGASAEAPAQGRTKPDDVGVHDGRETGSAGFRVPAMWQYTAPLIAPKRRDTDPSHAQKDPTVVFYGGK